MSESKMKTESPPLVLHVIHHLVIGGMENGLINLINHMPASKYRHAIICVEDYSDFRHRITRPGVEVIALHRSQIGVWKLRQQIYHLCRKLQPTIVHSRNQSGLDALLPARLAGVAHCFHGEHGWDVDDIEGTNWKPMILRRLHSPLVKRYITVSEHLKQSLINHVGISADRISQIYNGVDTDRFQPAIQKPLHLLPTHFQDNNLILIGSVGRIQAIKDQATLLHAFAMLIVKQPNLARRVRLMIVGSGPLLADLRALATSLKITELTWFPGASNKVPEILQTLDIFVLPSLMEGISNTILEAMATGIPVLATRVGGNIELVKEGVCGHLYPPGDSSTLSKLLLEYTLNASHRKEQGQAARQLAIEQFSLTSMVACYKANYDQVCQR